MRSKKKKNTDNEENVLKSKKQSKKQSKIQSKKQSMLQKNTEPMLI